MTEPRPPYRQRLAEYALVLALTSLALPGSALAGPMFHTVYRSYPKQRAGYPGSAAADFNRDGISDVAVTAGTRIQVFLGARGGSLWEAPGFQGAAEVQRRHGSDPWARIGTVTPTSGAIEFLDRDVVANERYGYRLVLVIQGRSITTDEAWVQVPGAPGLALAAPELNPTHGPIELSFTLVSRMPAHLDVLDLAGRRVVHRELTELGPRQHHLELLEPRAPGIYLLRLAQGTFVARTKICVIR